LGEKANHVINAQNKNCCPPSAEWAGRQDLDDFLAACDVKRRCPKRREVSHHPSGYYVIDKDMDRAYNTKELYSIHTS
jgi:hypothetical protein